MEQDTSLAPGLAEVTVYRSGDAWYGRRDADTVGPLASEQEVREYLDLLDAVQATRDMGPEETVGGTAEPVKVP